MAKNKITTPYHFNLKDIEDNVDYLLSMNELGNHDVINDLLKLSNRNSDNIIQSLKGSLILWYFYIKIANEVENYELSGKITHLIEIEKQDCLVALVELGMKSGGLKEYVDDIGFEIKDLMLG